MTISTRVIKLFLLNIDRPYVPLSDGLRLQVLPDMAALPRCQKHQFAAFIADKGVLVVWDDEPRYLLSRAEKLEKGLMEMVWHGELPQIENEKAGSKDGSTVGKALDAVGQPDAEAVKDDNARRIVLLQPFLTSVTLVLTLAAMGSGWRNVALEVFVDHNYLRLAFLAAAPAQMWLAFVCSILTILFIVVEDTYSLQFFFLAIAGNFAQLLGPVSQMDQNTKFYSGIAPRRLRRDVGPLPHVTIQCPVYKEGLRSVIEPTVRSVKAAISTYEMQGGTANIFVNDDGMQLLPEDEARARKDFYDEHNIGWVARPKHNPKPQDEEEQFVRRGKFKKASNMNYGLWISNRVEAKMADKVLPEPWSHDAETRVYNDALAEVIAEDAGRTWAEGSVRIGDYVLLIDSDTRVPTDCLLDAVSEMEQSPEVAILQYASGVMNVTDSFFERGITFFTNLIYTAIRFTVANGDVAPFVGHNAILRWSAVQEIAYDCKDDGREKFWSEATVSEDFDMALRLQTSGYLIRLGAYTGDGFKEGVSLTVYDELARWEKYAYGCNELIFHPVKYWLVKGPITPLFRRFLFSRMPLPSKLAILAYIGTYYALGSAWFLTLVNYFAVGWFNGLLDHYYVDSFKIYFSILLVFSAFGNVALAILRYRIKERTLISAFVENFKWIPLLTVFLGGISLHVSQALLSHMFSINMTWGATAKEAENTTFFTEIPKLLRKFRFTFIFCLACSGAMIALAQFVPPLWRIDLFIAIWPLGTLIFGHFFLPIALNPGLMLFTW